VTAVQPRVPAGKPGGGRFAPIPATLLRDVPPIPTPVADVPDERPNFTAVPVARCSHGSFVRWARRNCCAGTR
jgi:hypothetical protein